MLHQPSKIDIALFFITIKIDGITYFEHLAHRNWKKKWYNNNSPKIEFTFLSLMFVVYTKNRASVIVKNS